MLALSLFSPRDDSVFFTALLLRGDGVGGGLISFNTAGRGGDFGRSERVDGTGGCTRILNLVSLVNFKKDTCTPNPH